MLYDIYYCLSHDKCHAGLAFQNPCGRKDSDCILEFFAIYDSETGGVEYDKYFNWDELRGNWDKEINRAIQEVIVSPVIWYCLIHGDCHITDSCTSLETSGPCKAHSSCICEQIATYKSGEIISNVGDLVRYFDDADDGYKLEFLERELVSYKMSKTKI